VSGAPTVNPNRTGTKAAWWYETEVAPGETVEFRLRLAAESPEHPDHHPMSVHGFGKLFDQRLAEADEFYDSIAPADIDDAEKAIMRRAFAGMIWGKQFYRYNVRLWLDGDPDEPPPPPEHKLIRNTSWRNVDCYDVISMPDPWEYPWFAAWDLAFHTIALAHVDPAFAKYQLLVMCREWFQHPNGALPAYEWNFGDVNPPVQRGRDPVFEIDGLGLTSWRRSSTNSWSTSPGGSTGGLRRQQRVRGFLLTTRPIPVGRAWNKPTERPDGLHCCPAAYDAAAGRARLHPRRQALCS
jgi:hypothetical protein